MGSGEQSVGLRGWGKGGGEQSVADDVVVSIGCCLCSAVSVIPQSRGDSAPGLRFWFAIGGVVDSRRVSSGTLGCWLPASPRPRPARWFG